MPVHSGLQRVHVLLSQCNLTLSWLNCAELVDLLDPDFRILVIYYFLKFFSQVIDFRESLERMFRTKKFAFGDQLNASNSNGDSVDMEQLEKQFNQLETILTSKMLNTIIQNVLHSQQVFLANEQRALDLMDIFCVFVFLYLKINAPIYNQSSKEIQHYKDYFKSGSATNPRKNRHRRKPVFATAENRRVQLSLEHERLVHQHGRVHRAGGHRETALPDRAVLAQPAGTFQPVGPLRNRLR